MCAPDANPIEHTWAQEKSIRRKYQCTCIYFVKPIVDIIFMVIRYINDNLLKVIHLFQKLTEISCIL